MITVVIPTYNITPTLQRILYFLNFQTFKNFSVIISYTSENYLDYNIKTNYEISFIKAQETKAFSRNIGIMKSKTEYILLIDSDMIPHPNLIQEHINILTKYDCAAVVGLELRTKEEKEYFDINQKLDKINTSDQLSQIFKYNFSNSSRKIKKQRIVEWYKFLTGNLSFKREFFIKAGMFDVSFISYGFEDLELGYRMSKLGIDIIFNPRALTIHLHPLPLFQRIQNKKESVKNLKLFYQKYQNKSILNKLGINFFSKLIYDYLPTPLIDLLKKINQDYITNYYFWKEWNTKN